MKKDKQKVIGETLSDDRIKSLLEVRPADDTPVGYYILQRAYQSLREDDFARFLSFYVEAGFDINVTNQSGKAFLTLLYQHAEASPYVTAMEKLGATQ
ncbi:PA4642 family protein [Zooshikella sp. RANM57]|uniref:PA4642 family protein n=1 Tax=Zooshikella sp. RANM57 TaxID=3425863 RepID=UPI003D700676